MPWVPQTYSGARAVGHSAEVHSADGTTFIYRDGDDWFVVFQGKTEAGPPFKRRQDARDHVNALKVLGT